jgi:hypothetical protein
MELTFANRAAELKEVGTAATAGGLLVVFGGQRGAAAFRSSPPTARSERIRTCT